MRINLEADVVTKHKNALDKFLQIASYQLALENGDFKLPKTFVNDLYKETVLQDGITFSEKDEDYYTVRGTRNSKLVRNFCYKQVETITKDRWIFEY